MSMLYRAQAQVASLVEERHQRQCESNDAIQREYAAAQKIQSCWRGYIQRLRIDGMRKDVLKIQRTYRAFVGRKLFKKKLTESLAAKRVAFFDQQAILIQRHWRGYWSRKSRHDFYKRKQYIQAVTLKNLQISQLTEEELEKKSAEHERVKSKVAMKKLMQSPSGKGYMLSTATIRGVYNPPQGPLAAVKDIGVLENEIRKATRVQTKKSSRAKQQPLPPQPQPQWQIEAARKQQIQGPFRPITEVWAQRTKGLKPTLRVATSHTSEQDKRILDKKTEWTKRIQEHHFNATIDPKYPYVPSIHTSTEYGHIGYGTKTFRSYESAPGGRQDQWLGAKSFRTVVSPIPIFDEYEAHEATVS